MIETKRFIDMVRSTGLEPAHLTAYAPQTDVPPSIKPNKSNNQ